MKKVLKVLSIAFAAFLLFAGVANAQRTYDTLSVRNLRYTTLQSSGAPIVLTDSLKSDSASVLADLREGCIAVGYRLVVTSAGNSILNVDTRELQYYDGYLYVLDSNFNEIAYNDDFYDEMTDMDGSRCGSLISAGTYYVIVTKWNESSLNNNGVFNMTVVVEPTSYVVKTVDDFREIFLKSLPATSGVSEWIDSAAVGDTIFMMKGFDFMPDGEMVFSSVFYSESFPVAVYAFTLDSSMSMTVEIFDTIEDVCLGDAIVMDSRFRRIDDKNGGALKLDAGTYYLLFTVGNSRWWNILPMRFGIRTDFVDVADVNGLNYATIGLPYTDTTVCTSGNLSIYNQSPWGNRVSRLSGAYKLRMNADTLYHFSFGNLADNWSQTEIVLMDSNFERIRDFIVENARTTFDYLPEISGDYYITSLYNADADTSIFSFSAGKSEMPVFYVDSENGNDANDGTTPATAFATLAQIVSIDTSAVVNIMSDIDMPFSLVFDKVTVIKGYQNRVYVINGNRNSIISNGPQFEIGSRNANDTIIMTDISLVNEYESSMTLYDDVEYTAYNGRMNGTLVQNHGSLDIYGTRFHDIYGTAGRLLDSESPRLVMKGVVMENLRNHDILLRISGIEGVKNKHVIDSCTIEHCNAGSYLMRLKNSVFDVSNMKIAYDTAVVGITDGNSVVNLTDFDMEYCNFDRFGIINTSSSLMNFYSGNIKHNISRSGIFGNVELAQFNMYGGDMEDNFSMTGFFMNELFGVCDFRGGRFHDNVGLPINDMFSIPNATMRNMGGIVSLISSKITVRDSFSIDGDAFIMTDAPVTVGSALQGEDFATLLPLEIEESFFLKIEDSEPVRVKYEEGRQMLDGDSALVRSQYYKFNVAQCDTITWYIDNRGKLTSTPVGLNTAEQVAVKVYPNPTSDFLHIEAGNLVAEGVILDMQGRVIARQPIVSGSAKINMQNMANGVYFIQLSNDSHEVLATRKIIKK